jgi:hypothetical protein
MITREDVHDEVREEMALELGLLLEALHGLLTERRPWIGSGSVL